MNTFISVIMMLLIPLAFLFSVLVIIVAIVGLILEGISRFKSRQLLLRQLEHYQKFGKNLRKVIDRRQYSNRRVSEKDRREIAFA